MKLTIPQIKEAAKDFPIGAVQGILKTLFPQKTGKNAKGDWAIQRGVLQQGADEIEVLFKDRDALHSSWKGRTIIIEAHHGQKGWSGVYADDDTYNGATTRIVKVTPTGGVSLVDTSGNTQPAKSAQPAPDPKTEPAAEPKQQTPAAPDPGAQTGRHNRHPSSDEPNVGQNDPPPPKTPSAADRIAEAVAQANQVANLQLLCIGRVETYVAPRVKLKLGRDLETSERHAWAMNMCIELMRKGAQWHMPTAELPPPPPAKAPASSSSAPATGLHGQDQLF